MPETIEIKNLHPEELVDALAAIGEPRYRATQILSWIYEKGVVDFDAMTNLSKSLRANAPKHFTHKLLVPTKIQVSRDGTRKYLFELEDGHSIESVLIPDAKRRTLCVSSQVGCALKCGFCYTGTLGFNRNLETWEIMEQLLAVRRERPEEDWPTNIVFMGMGEPLLNYDNVMRAVRLMTLDYILKLSRRRVTVSTAGIPKGIERYKADKPSAALALSINAPDDATRSKIMPINDKYPLSEILKSLEGLPTTGRERITFEYVMLKGVNDSPVQARQLANIVKRFNCKVNLIALNPYPGAPFEPSPMATVEKFQDILIEKNLSVFIRKSRGSDILAACGQLAGESNAK